jgi:hypothetical protein
VWIAGSLSTLQRPPYTLYKNFASGVNIKSSVAILSGSLKKQHHLVLFEIEHFLQERRFTAYRKLKIPPITRKITFPKVHVTNDSKQNPPKKKGHIFLNFRASAFPTGI